MIDLQNRQILADGTVICNDAALVELLYQGQDLTSIVADNSNAVQLYNQIDQLLDTSFGYIETASEPLYKNVVWTDYWFTPEYYKNIDVQALCLDRCKDQNERARALKELDIFRKNNMMPVLQHLLYMIDHWRSHNIVWGVGRGSSVSSFVLYLIGINRINPLQWDLDIDEFFK